MLTHILLKLFKKTTGEGMLPNLLYKQSITLTPKQDTCHKTRQLQTDITDKYRCKNPQQNNERTLTIHHMIISTDENKAFSKFNILV